MSAVLQLEAQRERLKRDEFVTDADAPEGSHEWQRHRAHIALIESRGGESSTRRFHLENAEALVLGALPPLTWFVRGLIPHMAVIAVSGEPKASKTWAAIDLANGAASGQPVFGEFAVPKRLRVVYVALEDSRRSLRTRFIATSRGMGVEPAEGVAGLRLLTQTGLNLLSDADLCELAAACSAGGVDLLFIDPLRDAHNAEENDSGEMQEVMKRLRFLRDFLGCSVVFVHHTSKQSADTAGRRSGQRMRGSTAIHGAVDGGIYMSLSKATETEWVNTVEVELKAARGAGTFGLTLNVADDENGEATWAQWTYARETTSKGQAELTEQVDRLVALLEAAYRENEPGRRGLNRETIRTALGGIRTAKVSAVVAEAVKQGRARHDRSEGGTVFNPTPEEVAP
jgi:hypothetical protein